MRLSFKSQLLAGIATSLIVVIRGGTLATTWLIEKRLESEAAAQMDVASQSIQALVADWKSNRMR